MNKEYFLSGGSFKAIENAVYTYKHVNGFIYRILPSGKEFPLAVVDDVFDFTFRVSYVILGQSRTVSFNYSDFELF